MIRKPLRAATVSRILAQAGIPRARGYPQEGFQSRQWGNLVQGDEVRIDWYAHSKEDEDRGLRRCVDALTAAGYTTELRRFAWNDRYLVVTNPVAERHT